MSLPDPTPVALLCMDPLLKPAVYPDAVRTRISAVASLRDAATLTDAEALAGTTVLLTSWGTPPVDGAVLDRAPQLQAVLHAAGSVKTVVTPAVFERGILVSSAAAALAEPVAMLAYAFVVLAGRRALPLSAAYGSGEFTARHERMGVGADDKTVGIVGASHTGRALMRRLRDDSRAMLLHDPYCSPTAAAALGTELVDLDDLVAHSDVVSLHAPSLPETRHMIDRRRLAAMRDGTTLVNTARGRLVDTEALTAECRQGRLDALLDVTDPEPLPPDHPLHHLPNVFITPHLAGTEGSEFARMGRYAAAELERLVLGQPLEGLVRADQLTRLA